MSVFFIADTHFGDGNILRYENRPFATVEEMDQELVRRWNQKVGEKDTVFHLGDVSAHSAEEDRQLLGQLHGKKSAGAGQPRPAPLPPAVAGPGL